MSLYTDTHATSHWLLSEDTVYLYWCDQPYNCLATLLFADTAVSVACWTNPKYNDTAVTSRVLLSGVAVNSYVTL